MESSGRSAYDFGILTGRTRDEHERHFFWFCVVLAQVAGFTMLALVITWTAWFDYEIVPGTNRTTPGGFSEFPSFDYHPLFMTIGVVFLIGQSVLTFRVLAFLPRMAKRLIHMGIYILSIICMVVGLWAIFAINGGFGSVHDILGLTTVIIFSLQFIFGFGAKLFPGCVPEVAEWYAPIHNFFGALTFVLGSATALTGMSIAAQNDFTAAGNLCRFYVLALILFVFVVAFIVVNPKFKVVNGKVGNLRAPGDNRPIGKDKTAYEPL